VFVLDCGVHVKTPVPGIELDSANFCPTFVSESEPIKGTLEAMSYRGSPEVDYWRTFDNGELKTGGVESRRILESLLELPAKNVA
jgi:hypothetical protein